MSTPVGIIKKFVEALTKTTKTGTAAVDEALKNFGINGGYSVFKQKFSSDLSGKSNQDFLEQVCGVRLNNKDTGAITGSDAGGSTTKTNESIVPETAAAKELTDDEYNSFTKNGLTVNVTYDTSTAPDAKFNYDSETYLAKQKLVVRALYNWWVPESLDLINQSLGINFTDGRANINEINVVFTSFNNDNGATNTSFSYDMGRASEVTLKINTNLLYNMTANDKNGTLDGQKRNWSDLYDYSTSFTNYLDRLILISLAEIALKANVPYVNKLPLRVAYGLCEIVGGYDSASVNYSDFTNAVSYYDDSYLDYIRPSGYALMRYLAKNYSDGTPDETLPAGLSYNDAKTVLTATTKFADDKIDLADYVTTVKTVDASKLTKAVYIVGNDLANSLKGGSGTDTLDGGKGNDTLTGGKGNDVFLFGVGKDVITDYAEGDKISLSAAITNASVKGSDVILTLNGNSLTVKNGKGKTLSLIDSAGKSSSTILGGSSSSTTSGGKTLTITNSTKSPVTLASTYKNADASKRTTAVKITGNSAANSIVGGSKNDTLNGGAGNDTLTGGKGNDVFIYTAGNDVIADFASGDKISLGSAISKSSVKGSDVIFTVGKNTLTVKNGKGKTLTLVDKKGKTSTTVVGGDSSSTTSGGGGKSLTVSNTTKSPVKLASGVVTADASKRTKAVKITGNDAANLIYGGKGNDTLDGGKGNDSLWGNAGDDVFLYSSGEGKDVIYGFDKDDMLLITGAFSGTYNKSKKEIAFKVGSTANAVTLKDFGSTTSFNVNGYDYQISGTKLVKS